MHKCVTNQRPTRNKTNHTKETKRNIGITDKQLIKLIENTQKIEEKKYRRSLVKKKD